MSQPEQDGAAAAWKPSGPALSVPAAPKGERVDVYAKMRRGLVTSLVLQGIFVLVLGGAGVVAMVDAPKTARLYWWACVIPLGFALVAWLAYRRGVAGRQEGRWTRDWEKGEVKRSYRLMGVVLVVWMLGLVAILLMA